MMFRLLINDSVAKSHLRSVLGGIALPSVGAAPSTAAPLDGRTTLIS
jgi:hypothetical protein